MELATLVGALAATASVASFAPQAVKIIRTRETEGLSAAMYALTASAFALWLTFGILRSEWSLIIPNALCLALAAFILMMIMLPPRKRDAVADALTPDTSE